MKCGVIHPGMDLINGNMFKQVMVPMEGGDGVFSLFVLNICAIIYRHVRNVWEDALRVARKLSVATCKSYQLHVRHPIVYRP